MQGAVSRPQIDPQGGRGRLRLSRSSSRSTPQPYRSTSLPALSEQTPPIHILFAAPEDAHAGRRSEKTSSRRGVFSGEAILRARRAPKTDIVTAKRVKSEDTTPNNDPKQQAKRVKSEDTTPSTTPSKTAKRVKSEDTTPLPTTPLPIGDRASFSEAECSAPSQ